MNSGTCFGTHTKNTLKRLQELQGTGNFREPWSQSLEWKLNIRKSLTKISSDSVLSLVRRNA